MLSNHGTKISKIVLLDDMQLKKAVSQIQDQDVVKQKRIDDLIFPMLQFDEDEINRLLESYYTEMGAERTFTDVLYPVMEKIGILWLTDEVDPVADNHLLLPTTFSIESHVIRRT
mgnify:CR=1 FL=1